MKTYHVIALTVVVEQRDDTHEDESAAHTMVATMVRHAAAAVTDLTGRHVAVRSIVVEPLKVIELEVER